MDDTEDKTCAFCNKETLLAFFGVAIGVLFIAMGLDTLRRMRMSTVDNVESYIDGSTVDD